jgi:hypothetical protein
MAWGSISKYPSLLVLHDARHAQDKAKTTIRDFIWLFNWAAQV